MNRRSAVGVLVACATLAGCGGGASGGTDSLGDSLGYLPDDAPLVAVLSTDLDSDHYAALDDKLDTIGVPGGVEDRLREAVEEETEAGAEPLSYEEDVRPLLGEDLVVGVTGAAALASGEGLVAAIEVGDSDKLAALLESPYFELRRDGEAEGADLYRPEDSDEDSTAVALDDETLVVADSEPTLRDALKRHRGEDKLDSEAFSEAVEGLPEEALLRILASPEQAFSALPELDAAREIPWVGAIRAFGATVSVDDDGLLVDAALKTDPDGLSRRRPPAARGRRGAGAARA